MTDLTTKLAEALRLISFASMDRGARDTATEALRLYDEAKAQPVQDLPPLPAIDDYLPTDGPRWTTANFIACVQRYATDYARAALAATPAPAEPHVWLYDFMDGTTTTVRNWSTTNKAEAFAPGNFNQRGYVPVEN